MESSTAAYIQRLEEMAKAGRVGQEEMKAKMLAHSSDISLA
jgi:hypothetical protein